jgi:hypothetical protein
MTPKQRVRNAGDAIARILGTGLGSLVDAVRRPTPKLAVVKVPASRQRRAR